MIYLYVNFQVVLSARKLGELFLLCFTDFSVNKFKFKKLLLKVNHIFLEPSQCCKWNFLKENCTCPEGNPSNMFQTHQLYEASSSYIKTLRDLDFPKSNSNCSNDVQLKELFNISHRLPIDAQIFSKNKTVESFGNIPKRRRLFKIGIWESPPWAYQERDAETDRVIMNFNRPVWGGFCVDVINKLSELMNFDYELASPRDVSIVSNRRGGSTADLYTRVCTLYNTYSI